MLSGIKEITYPVLPENILSQQNKWIKQGYALQSDEQISDARTIVLEKTYLGKDRVKWIIYSFFSALCICIISKTFKFNCEAAWHGKGRVTLQVATPALNSYSYHSRDRSITSIFDVFSPYKIQETRMRGKHKFVHIVEGTNLVLKIPKYKGLPANRNEYAAYIISKRLGLDAAPFCALINDQKKQIEQEKALFRQHPGLKKVIADRFGAAQFMILQEYVPKDIDCDMKVDIENAHKVLFFNIIIGRRDLKIENSMADENGHVWEVDNNFIGNNFIGNEEHWLMRVNNVQDCPISDGLLDHMLSLNPVIDPTELDGFEGILECVKMHLTVIQSIIRSLRDTNQNITFKSILESRLILNSG